MLRVESSAIPGRQSSAKGDLEVPTIAATEQNTNLSLTNVYPRTPPGSGPTDTPVDLSGSSSPSSCKSAAPGHVALRLGDDAGLPSRGSYPCRTAFDHLP